MQTMEADIKVNSQGQIQLPEEFKNAYGQSVRLVVYLPERAKGRVKQRKPGSAKGILQVISEDDEYLEDFKEYM